MNLKDIILGCNSFEDTEEYINVVFAQKIGENFQHNSNAIVLEIPVEEMENLKLQELTEKYCTNFDYFLEMFVLQDFYNDLTQMEEYKSDDKKVERLIYYAKNDA